MTKKKSLTGDKKEMKKAEKLRKIKTEQEQYLKHHLEAIGAAIEFCRADFHCEWFAETMRERYFLADEFTNDDIADIGKNAVKYLLWYHDCFKEYRPR